MFKQTDPSWHAILQTALSTMDPAYLKQLEASNHWLPGSEKIFNAFSLPLENTRYILFGESPYPRAQSANGYAFWDAAVDHLWSETGLSKSVNRATSLRNFIKMLLVARKDLTSDCSQPAIAKLEKTHYIQTIQDLFNHLMNAGFLLLNASLVLSEKYPVNQEAKFWQPFMSRLLTQLADSDIKLVLFGNIAKKLEKSDHQLIQKFDILKAEHPYNLSFISNTAVLEFFQPFNLLCVNTP